MYTRVSILYTGMVSIRDFPALRNYGISAVAKLNRETCFSAFLLRTTELVTRHSLFGNHDFGGGARCVEAKWQPGLWWQHFGACVVRELPTPQ